ncbi:MAG: sigma-70 family RNA polymerase sigma factor [Actinomycetota bacterium]|nr:sigma-70 family RNA polymerase sigma factor [Actinomycetota bacterium]
MTDVIAAEATGLSPNELTDHLEGHRRELTGYCYRMLGSSFEAEDAVQETMIRAWRAYDRFEGRSSLRSWLYRIATNVCFDSMQGRQRRARPMDMGPAGGPEPQLGPPLAESVFIEPVPDNRVIRDDGDPAEVAEARESIRLAFVAALQVLPPTQRAVLILREVLRWTAAEVATLLGTTVVSVNSSLQRARATLAATAPDETEVVDADGEQQELLARYLDAFERYDLDALVELLHEDATLSMPPYDLWLRGHDAISYWLLGPGLECKGSRLVPTTANGSPAFGQYRASGPGGSFEPWALQVLEIADGRVVALNSFLDTARLFPLFGLPESPPD